MNKQSLEVMFITVFTRTSRRSQSWAYNNARFHTKSNQLTWPLFLILRGTIWLYRTSAAFPDIR